MDNPIIRGLVMAVLFIILTSDVPQMISKLRRLDEGPEDYEDNSIVIKKDKKDDGSRSNAVYYKKAGKLKKVELTDDEKKELVELRDKITKTVQEWCIPKIVCELHASYTENDVLSDVERALLNLIRETNLMDASGSPSPYHFAAHMGTLLNGVEGNGCHNLYPNCPISRLKILQKLRV